MGVVSRQLFSGVRSCLLVLAWKAFTARCFCVFVNASLERAGPLALQSRYFCGTNKREMVAGEECAADGWIVG